MKIFSGSANKPLAEKIVHELGIPLSPLEIHVFPDGEKRVRVLERVVNQHCVVVQPTSTPADAYYMELFFIADALKRSGALKVTALIPYLGYQRQDHVFRDGEARSLGVIIQIIEAVGIDQLITFDLHSIKIPELFRISVTHLSALPLFAEKIREIGEVGGILVSPDMGGVRRIKLLSEMLDNMPYAAVNKERDLATGKITGDFAKELSTDLEKGGIKRAFIVDDMISTGGTIAQAAGLLQKKGVEEIYCFATHPVFSGDVRGALQNSALQKIFVTDSIFVPQEKQFSELEILSIAPLTAKTIRDIM